MTKQAIQDVYKEYLSQSSIGFLDEISAHENEHDNSGDILIIIMMPTIIHQDYIE